MKKKGFTLIELLAVIAIIAIISLIAVPNIINISDNIRKNNMLDDAKKLISLAKLKVNADYEIRNFTKENICNEDSKYCIFSYDTLNENKDIQKEADSDAQYSSSSYVKYFLSGDIVNYCVYLDGSKRHIGTNENCVSESGLYANNVVQTK